MQDNIKAILRYTEAAIENSAMSRDEKALSHAAANVVIGVMTEISSIARSLERLADNSDKAARKDDPLAL